MPAFRDGQANVFGFTNPGVYVGQVFPTPFIPGLPTNIEAAIGVGSWGPVNAVTAFSDSDSCPYGPPQARQYDISRHVAVACQQGRQINFRGIRVSDGTDLAATATVPAASTGASIGVTAVAKYTGSRGNQITITIQPTAKAGSYAVVINFPGRAPERFDNITGTGNAFWVALAAAVNNGTDQRTRSDYVVLTAGASTAAPTLNTPVTLAAGTDGASGVTTSTLVGTDTLPRTGMFALRGLKRDTAGTPDTFCLVDCTDTSAWSAMLSLAIQETMFAIVTMPSGSTIAQAVAARTSQGIDDTSIKIIVGDWPTVYVPGLGAILVSPLGVAQGLYGNLSPEQSPINKPLIAVSATSTSQTGVLTSDAEESVAQVGGVDFIGRSAALGQDFFSFMTGRNASSNTAAQGDEYTRLTNFLIRSLETSATRSIVGKLQSIRADDPTRLKAKAVLDSFFGDLKSPEFGSDGYGVIEDFAVVCDETNNTPTTIARGFLFAYCKVKYLNTVRYFVIRLAGGGNVQINAQSTQPTLATVFNLAA